MKKHYSIIKKLSAFILLCACLSGGCDAWELVETFDYRIHSFIVLSEQTKNVNLVNLITDSNEEYIEARINLCTRNRYDPYPEPGRTIDTLAIEFDHARLYPGIPEYSNDFTILSYARAPYLKEFNELIDATGTREKVEMHYGSGGYWSETLWASTALYNKIDSVDIICTNQIIDGRPPHTSLKDKALASASYFNMEEKEFMTLNCTASEWYSKTKGGLRYITKYESYGGVPERKVYIGMRVPIETANNKGKEYTFQATLYSDDLVIKSNEASITLQ